MCYLRRWTTIHSSLHLSMCLSIMVVHLVRLSIGTSIQLVMFACLYGPHLSPPCGKLIGYVSDVRRPASLCEDIYSGGGGVENGGGQDSTRVQIKALPTQLRVVSD